MPRSTQQLTDDALKIWQAGVAAVRADRLMDAAVQCDSSSLTVMDETIDLGQFERIAVVGAGKAGAGMAAALEKILGSRLMEEKKLTGWVNVPQGCESKLQHIMLHAARPAGVNEPTEAGLSGSREILKIAGSLTDKDLCLCLISGGGSALMPSPVDEISLDDLLAITKHLSAAGANIAQLNTVRKQLSKIKGGGLARACGAGRLISLVISDVPGDPLDLIASGPTVVDHSTPQQAIEILTRYKMDDPEISKHLLDYLTQKQQQHHNNLATDFSSRVTNLVIGNNATAVDAAGMMAEKLGYSHAMTSSNQLEGEAESIGRHLAHMAGQMLTDRGPNCLITGGEPVVKLIDSSRRGKGGRNQQLVLAALIQLGTMQLATVEGIALLSGGTDGEDGPTDAAGAMINQQIAAAILQKKLDPDDYLQRNDAYHFFDSVDALIRTGATNTNVCDLRVLCVDRDPNL